MLLTIDLGDFRQNPGCPEPQTDVHFWTVGLRTKVAQCDAELCRGCELRLPLLSLPDFGFGRHSRKYPLSAWL